MGEFMKNYYTIVKSGADWRILSAKNEKIATSQNYRTQKDAIEAARNLIKNGRDWCPFILQMENNVMSLARTAKIGTLKGQILATE